MVFNITSMLQPDVYDHPAENIKLIETHISWVILTGDFAYKIKKPVDFGFLDFSTIEKRQHFCEQELRLNRRLAPAIYLDVVSITGTAGRPRISGSGTVLEYAVKMTQFPQSAQLDNMLAAGELKLKHMDALAHMVADFHRSTDVADAAMNYGNKDVIYQPVEENFKQINEHQVNEHQDSEIYSDRLAMLLQWNSSELTKQQTVMTRRKADGFIRQCHGDMHLRNLLWLNDKPMAFDCIEFNAKLSWVDVISDIAFLIMDLQHRQQHQLANRFLNSYFEITGDYAGLSVLPFYLCYRALVRAKVNTLRLKQKDLTVEERKKTTGEFETYLELAITYTQQTRPKLIILHGLSASGKSTVSRQLLDVIGAIRIRSDVERKRLFKIVSTDNVSDKVDADIYTADASQQVYTKLLELASMIIKAGYSLIVDATFLKQKQREPFQKLAKQLKTPYIILQTTAPAEVLRQRISQRKNNVSDAGLAVLEHQISNWQPLHDNEKKFVVSVNTENTLNINMLITMIKTI